MIHLTLHSDGGFAVSIPRPDKTPVNVRVPLNIDGLFALRAILSAQIEQAGPATFGTMSAPTQGMIDRWLADPKNRVITKKPRKESHAKISDEELNALLEDMEIDI